MTYNYRTPHGRVQVDMVDDNGWCWEVSQMTPTSQGRQRRTFLAKVRRVGSDYESRYIPVVPEIKSPRPMRNFAQTVALAASASLTRSDFTKAQAYLDECVNLYGMTWGQE